MEATSLTADTVLYLYGFVRPSAAADGLTGIEEGSSVFLVRWEDVACAASLVPAQPYQRPPDRTNPAAQLEWIGPRACRHDEILRRLHSDGAVVPLKFGSLSASIDDVKSILRRCYEPITSLIARFAGQDEWTLTVGADGDGLSARVLARRPDLIAAQQDADQRAEGAAYFARKRLEKAIADRVGDEITAVADRVGETLMCLGLEPVAASSRTATARPGRGAHVLVMSAALLVDRRSFPSVETSLSALETEHTDVGLTCQISGPWPPYSFTGPLDASSSINHNGANRTLISSDAERSS